MSTGKLDAATNSTTLSLAKRQTEGGLRSRAKGTLTGGATPRFAGDVSYRLPPPRAKEGETPTWRAAISCSRQGQGDDRQAAADRIHAAAGRETARRRGLTGAAEIALGRRRHSRRWCRAGGGAAAARRDERADRPAPMSWCASSANCRRCRCRRSRGARASTSTSSICGRCRCGRCASMRRRTGRAGRSAMRRRRCRDRRRCTSSGADGGWRAAAFCQQAVAGVEPARLTCWRGCGARAPDNPLFGSPALSGTVALSADTLSVADGKAQPQRTRPELCRRDRLWPATAAEARGACDLARR